MSNQVLTEAVLLTPTAVQAVRDIFAERKLEGYALRVYVAGRTCSGLQYGMALDNKPRETDFTFETDGIKVLVDEQSIVYMQGATIDFVNDERGTGFQVNNPNQIPNCDCSSGSCG